MKVFRGVRVFLVHFFIFVFGSQYTFSATGEGLPQDFTTNLLGKGVVVRVWSGALHGGESVGHVSLQTSASYVSFWPKAGTPGQFILGIEEDLIFERGRPPESTIFLPHPSFDSLDGLHKDFEFLKELLAEGHLRWAMDGEVQPLKKKITREYYSRSLQLLPRLTQEDQRLLDIYDVWVFNCASIVTNLLINKKYVNWTDSLNTSLIPDRVAHMCAMEFLQQYFGKPRYEVTLHVMGLMSGMGGVQSHHVEFLGRKLFKSLGSTIVLNTSVEEDIKEEIRIEATGGLPRALARLAVSNGLGEIFAEILGPRRTSVLLQGVLGKK